MASYKQFYAGIQEIPDFSTPLAELRTTILAVPNVTTAEEIIAHNLLHLVHFVVEDTTVNALVTARLILGKIVEASYPIQFLTGSLVTTTTGP